METKGIYGHGWHFYHPHFHLRVMQPDELHTSPGLETEFSSASAVFLGASSRTWLFSSKFFKCDQANITAGHLFIAFISHPLRYSIPSLLSPFLPSSSPKADVHNEGRLIDSRKGIEKLVCSDDHAFILSRMLLNSSCLFAWWGVPLAESFPIYSW